MAFADLRQIIPTNTSQPTLPSIRSLKARLEAYYTLIAPDTIKDSVEWRTKFDQIYQKYGGSYTGERKLANKLAKKYGNAVRLMVAQNPSQAKTAKEGTAKDQRSGGVQEESWFPGASCVVERICRSVAESDVLCSIMRLKIRSVRCRGGKS